MEHKYWHKKWQQNDIGFHETDGNVLLKRYLPILDSNKRNRIFVPLCGKTKDISYLLKQGFEVVAVELSETAIIQLFADLAFKPVVTEVGALKKYTCHDLCVYVGDVFVLTSDLVGEVTAIYDRAALVALPSKMRERYASLLPTLTHNAKQLLLTFSYDQNALAGPPFCVTQENINALYGDIYSIDLLAQVPVTGGLKGKVAADCLVFCLEALHYD